MATVTTEQELRDAIAAADPQIFVANDIGLSTQNNVNYDLEITSGGASLAWEGTTNRTMFALTGGATLTIRDIVLDGLGKYHTLVSITASTLIMEEGAVLRRVQSNSNNCAVKIGTLVSPSPTGTFLMRSGLITGVQLDACVSCSGGTITMSGDAAIMNNTAYGIGINGGTVNMTDNAKISSNVADRTGIGIIATSGSIVNMGLKEGDAPAISDNESTNSYAGGMYLVDSTLNMEYGAAISGNKALNLAGGVGMSGSTLNMNGSAAIYNNTTINGGGGGLFIAGGSKVYMADDSAVYGNAVAVAGGRGGGAYLQQTDSTLNLVGNAAIYSNSADLGAGVYINTGTFLIMGADPADSPSIADNTAADNGGGIYLNTGGTATLHACSSTRNNTAAFGGNGIYNTGVLNVGQNIRITDGLHFGNAALSAPVITEPLGDDAVIQLEECSHVSMDNIPALIGIKGDAYTELQDCDCAFLAPASFPAGTPVFLNADRDQVLLGLSVTIGLVTLVIKRIDPR